MLQGQGGEFAKSIKVNLTKKVVACQLDQLNAVEQLKIRKKRGEQLPRNFDSRVQSILQLEQVLEVCVENLAEEEITFR